MTSQEDFAPEVPKGMPTARRGSMPGTGYFTGSKSGENEATARDVMKVVETGTAPIEGFARGVTMGLYDPAMVGAGYLGGQVIPGVQRRTLKDVAAAWKGRQERLMTEHPIGTLAGEIAGSVRTGLALPKLAAKVLPARFATGIPSVVGQQAVQGGVMGGTQEVVGSVAEDRDYQAGVPATSAAIGAVTAGVLTGMGKGFEKFAQTNAGRYVAQEIERLMIEKPLGWADKIKEIVKPIRAQWADKTPEGAFPTPEEFIFKGKSVVGKTPPGPRVESTVGDVPPPGPRVEPTMGDVPQQTPPGPRVEPTMGDVPQQVISPADATMARLTRSTFVDVESAIMSGGKKDLDQVLKDNGWTFDEYYAASKAREANQAANLAQGTPPPNALGLGVADSSTAAQAAAMTDEEIANGLIWSLRQEPSAIYGNRASGYPAAVRNSTGIAGKGFWPNAMQDVAAGVTGGAAGAVADYGLDFGMYAAGMRKEEPGLKDSLTSGLAGLGALGGLVRFGGSPMSLVLNKAALASGVPTAVPVAIGAETAYLKSKREPTLSQDQFEPVTQDDFAPAPRELSTRQKLLTQEDFTP